MSVSFLENIPSILLNTSIQKNGFQLTTTPSSILDEAGRLEEAKTGILKTSTKQLTQVSDVEFLGLASSLRGTNLEEKGCPIIVSTTAGITELIDAIEAAPTHPPSLYVDLEGVNLSRNGSISILQIYILSRDETYLVDVHTLNEDAFTHRTPRGRTLKDILESPSTPKVFFDVRNDSDALYSHFGISLAGVQDLQLMELATRRKPKRLFNGLSRCIEQDAPMTAAERQAWHAAKEKGKTLFAPERGGSYEVFNARPLAVEITQYCIQDVRYLPKLWEKYNRKLSGIWASKVETEVRNRIMLSQSDNYNGKGRHMALAPRDWASTLST